MAVEQLLSATAAHVVASTFPKLLSSASHCPGWAIKVATAWLFEPMWQLTVLVDVHEVVAHSSIPTQAVGELFDIPKFNPVTVVWASPVCGKLFWWTLLITGAAIPKLLKACLMRFYDSAGQPYHQM